MHFNSKKISLLTLAITSLVLSRAMFFFFNDPEGPNLLIVTGMAVIVYFLSLGACSFNVSGVKRILLAIVVQILIVIGFYFCLS